MRTKLVIILFLLAAFFAKSQVEVGASRFDQYIGKIQGKKVGLVGNHTTQVNQTHLVDTLLAQGVEVKKLFSPEHGFRGDAEAGAQVDHNKDPKTGLPIISLYGEAKKPKPKHLDDLDYMIFDIQDVGCRFYTYIATLHYVMEACAEHNVPIMVLDRPNPNGFYISGPVLDEDFQSFVGMHPVPIVYGMTIGEYAKMINGEEWLKDNVHSDLTVVKLENYTHDTLYELPIAPSPNLPNMDAVYLYPSLCLFEGTDVSVGRGTDHPFQVIGKPEFEDGNYTFQPRSIEGVAESPKYEGQTCQGFKLNKFCHQFILPSGELYLYWLTGFYEAADNKNDFFNSYFDKLAGTDQLRKQIENGTSVDEIKKSWENDLQSFKQTRKQYLLYEDFTKRNRAGQPFMINVEEGNR